MGSGGIVFQIVGIGSVLLAWTKPTCAVIAGHVKFVQDCGCLDRFCCFSSFGFLGVGLACLGFPVGIKRFDEHEIEVRVAETGPNPTSHDACEPGKYTYTSDRVT